MYVSKESLARQGGFGLALEGPQHDEAWLIFLDMVHNFMPTFEQKADKLPGIGLLCSAPGSDCAACANYHGMILCPRTIKTLIPYRAMGPVTVDEYESLQERYDE